MQFWKSITTKTIWLLLLLVLVACGGNETAEPTAEPTATPAPVATTASSETNTAAAAEPTTSSETGTDAAAIPVNTKINLNDMTEEQLLTTIPDFGNRMVREFFEYQPYVSIQQFRREIGKYVDDAQVAEYEKYVYVPVDVDNSDAETLKQIPGIDDTIAEALISARPYGTNETFLAKLAEYVTAEQVAAAATYLVTP